MAEGLIASSAIPTPGSSGAGLPQQPDSTNASVEDDLRRKLDVIIEQFSHPQLLEQYFADVIYPVSNEVVAQRLSVAVQGILSQFRLASYSQDIRDNVVRWLVDRMRHATGDAATLMFDSLVSLVASGLCGMKTMSEALVRDLRLTQPDIWRQTFDFLTTHVHKLDYKSARDLLKLLLDCLNQQSYLSVTSPWTDKQLEMLECGVKVVALICDRKQNLLPAYFVINEVLKVYNALNSRSVFNTCWKLAELMVGIVESFRPLAQILSVQGRIHLFPVVGHGGLHGSNAWCLDPVMLRVQYKGLLPFERESMCTQRLLIYNIMRQPGSREPLSILLAPYRQEKQRTPGILEDIYVASVLRVMEWAERDATFVQTLTSQRAWQQLSASLISFVLMQLMSFPRAVGELHKQLGILKYRKSRDELMWILLQFLSGGIKNNPLEDFFGVLDLYHLLYSGEEKFTVTGSDLSCVRAMAPTCIWIHMIKKSSATQHASTPRLEIPPSINTQMKFLQDTLHGPFSRDDYMLSVLCNAYSTTTEVFNNQIIPLLLEPLTGQSNTPPSVATLTLPGGLLAEDRRHAFTFAFLESLTIHNKMNIVHSLCGYLTKFLVKGQYFPAPAAVETYSRMLLYPEIDSLGIKNFSGVLLGQVLKSGNAELMHIMTEIISFRLCDVSSHSRLTILMQLNQCGGTGSPFTSPQLLWGLLNCMCLQFLFLPSCEAIHSAMFMRAIMQFVGGSETAGQRQPSLVCENEELAKVLVLILARGIVLSGPYIEHSSDYYREVFVRLCKTVPHQWPTSSLLCFPKSITDLYVSQSPLALGQQHPLIKKALEEEYSKWRTLSTYPENSTFDHFSKKFQQQAITAQNSTPPVFLCLLHRLVYEGVQLTAIIYRILDSIGVRQILAHVRCLVDFVVFEMSSSANGPTMNRSVEALATLVWRYGIVPFEQLMFIIVMRPYENNEARAGILLMDLLLHQYSPEFQTRCNYLFQHFQGNYWTQADPFTRLLDFHTKFPERFWPDYFAELSGQGEHCPYRRYMPVYFGNSCFRFVPILDLLVFRLIELASVVPLVDQVFINVLDKFGMLYRYHPQTARFLYSTLVYYDKKLRDHPGMRRKLIKTVVDAAIFEHRAALSTDFHSYCQQPLESAVHWHPEPDYYARLVGRVISALRENPTAFASSVAVMNCPVPMHNAERPEFRFGEHGANPGLYVLHAVCIELMGLPAAPQIVGAALVDLILNSHSISSPLDLGAWTNAVSIVLTALPISYLNALYQALLDELQSDAVRTFTGDILAEVRFDQRVRTVTDSRSCRLMALAHAVFQQSSTGYVVRLPQFVRDECRPVVSTESQLLYVCQLIGPFILRFVQEKYMKYVMQLAVDLYEMLLVVDQANMGNELHCEEIVTDLFYHLKYQHVGDYIKTDVDRIIPQLRPSLQAKLRFISHHQGSDAATGTT